MNPFVHILGISIKYVLINTKMLLKLLFQRQKLNLLNSDNIDTVVFTHNLGGGTLNYEKQNFYAENVLIFRVISYRNDFCFSIENAEDKLIATKKNVFNFVKSLKIKNVIVNSLCGYKNPEQILLFVMNNFRTSFNKYLVHDYHCICNKNNATLLLKEKYCGLKCSECKLGKKAEKWRMVWHGYFKIVNEIVCFSNSSKEILTSVFPELKNRILIIPHSMDYCTFSPLNIKNACNIAVVGNCSNIPKGKNVIKKLVKATKKARNRKLYIVGKAPFFFHHNSRFVEYSGKYNLKFLPEILESGQIGVVVFTSILPETFSYAVSEFMMLGLYIVSLNLGAQGEKLKNYEKAIFVKDLRPETILEGVEKCFTL